MLKTLVLLAVVICMSSGVPVYLDTEELMLGDTMRHPMAHPDPMVQDGVRVRRSPQQFGLGANAYPGGAGSLRAQFDTPQWTSDNGRHSFQGNAYYQRNFNMPGPRQDYGAAARYTFRF